MNARLFTRLLVYTFISILAYDLTYQRILNEYTTNMIYAQMPHSTIPSTITLSHDVNTVVVNATAHIMAQATATIAFFMTMIILIAFDYLEAIMNRKCE